MMSKVFIDRPIFAIVISIIIVVLGFTSMQDLPIEQYSNITPPMVEVNAEYVGADASTVDKSVATPIGQNIMGVSNMLYMNSTSANDGTMTLNVTFDIDADPDISTVLTQNRVTSAMSLLPTPVKQQAVTTQKQNQNYIMVFSIYSDDGRFTNEFLSNYAYINVRNELLKINGVGGVSILGASDYSMRVWVEPDKLSYLGLTVNDISSAIEAQSNIFPIGKLGAEPIDSPTAFTYTIVTPNAINTPEEYENIIIRTESDGTTLRLKDVARVELGCQTYGTEAKYNGLNATAVVVYQSPGSNAVEAGQQVIETMDRLSAKFPESVKWGSIVDAKKIIVRSVKEIMYTFLFVLLLVAIIIYIFLQNPRATIIPLIAIPVSLIGTFILFPFFGLTLNTLSLLGLVLAIGLVVDDAVVVVEAVQFNIEKGMSPYDATVDAMRKVSRAIIATTIVLVAVFIPIAKISGISGRLFWQFAVTIALSFVISAFNALSLTPALCAMILRSKKVREEDGISDEDSKKGIFGWFNRFFSRQRNFYIKMSDKLFTRRSRTWIMICVAFVILLVGFRLVPSGFMPEEDQGYLMVSVTLPDAASVERTFDAAIQLDTLLRKYDYIENVIVVAGFDLISGIQSTNSAVVFISLTDSNTKKIGDIVSQLNEDLYGEVKDGLVYAFGPPAIPGLGVSSGFTIELLGLSGNSPMQMQHYANLFVEKAMQREEISMVINQFSTTIPQKEIIINNEAVKKSNVDINMLHQVLAGYLGGTYVNNFNRFGQLYQTYVQADASYRRDEKSLENFFVPSSNGNVQVPLLSLLTIKDTLGVQYLNRFNMLPSISLNGTAADGYSSGQVIKALEEVAAEVLPEDMTYGWSDVTYQEVNSSKDTWVVFVFILGFIYLILAALYESWAVPLTIILGIPFAIMGAIATIYITHFFDAVYVNDIYFQISAVVLIALSAKNAILIIEYAHTAYQSGSDLRSATIEALRERYRPIVMTSLAFMLGAVPLIAATGIFSVARNIIGVSLLGGMLAVTFLAITIYPSLYESFSRFVKRNVLPNSNGTSNVTPNSSVTTTTDNKIESSDVSDVKKENN